MLKQHKLNTLNSLILVLMIKAYVNIDIDFNMFLAPIMG